MSWQGIRHQQAAENQEVAGSLQTLMIKAEYFNGKNGWVRLHQLGPEMPLMRRPQSCKNLCHRHLNRETIGTVLAS